MNSEVQKPPSQLGFSLPSIIITITITNLETQARFPQSPGSGLTFWIAWENSRHMATLPLVSPPNDVWQKNAEIPYWWRVTTQISVVLLIGRAAWEIWFNQSEALPRSGIQEFLRSFLKRHWTRSSKPLFPKRFAKMTDLSGESKRQLAFELQNSRVFE